MKINTASIRVFSFVLLLLVVIRTPTQNSSIAYGQILNASNPNVESLCDRLGDITLIPMKQDERGDEFYNTLLTKGKDSVPCLISQITNTRIMNDPRQAPKYNNFKIGDAAFFIFLRITKQHMEDFLPSSASAKIKDEGVYAYFRYVNRISGRKYIQNKSQSWFATNYKNK